MAKSTRFYPPFRKLLLTPYFSNIFELKLIWLLILTFTYHIQHHQEPPCPPRLQEETWRTGWALMRFLLMDIDEIFRKASLLYCLTSDTIKKVVRNLHVLQDSRKRLGEQLSLGGVSVVGSWWNFQENIFIILSDIQHNQKSHQEPLCPPRLQEETWRTGWVLMGFLLLDLYKIFRKAYLLYSLPSDTI